MAGGGIICLPIMSGTNAMQPQSGAPTPSSTPSMDDEFHHCPACGRRTRHRVSRDRKLAPVLWCQSCFHVHVQGAPTATRRQDQAA